MIKEIPKVYQALDHEEGIYKKWEKSGFFNPDNLVLPENSPNYTIILPPPNITAKLHLGHSAMIAIEDLLIRYKRMRGYRTLWLPGTDHAAIATQNVVERKILKEQNKTRHDLGRERFLEEVKSFVNQTQNEIISQIKKMGASLDWSRLAFTLDEKRERAVREMFCQMHQEGVIYRGERLVNWCPRCHSTLADDELDYEESSAKLYWIKYGPFVLATTRPETKLGDTAVAVHPKDKRYKDYIGKDLEIEGVLGKFMVKVVADEAVDMDFGSGAIKVTPAHSFVDDQIAKRHNLPSKKIIDEDGKMMANCGKYQGMTTQEAREAIVKDMEKMGLIDHIEDGYLNKVAHCYRCGAIIEPLPSKQWFVNVDKKLARLGNKSLKEKALAVALNNDIEFVPQRFKKRYTDWMEKLHDWCISRQIWYGHRVPVWYRGEEIYCGLEEPKGEGWQADPDTLDTWFSSGMWTFSTLGWPENYIDGKKTGDLAKFHPTQVMETGYEIITLWVSRMIMMSYFALGEQPFSVVYLHGMILDEHGKKMSKSRGNGIDPKIMAKKYGADSVRLALLMGYTPGNDARFSEEKIAVKRNFINKVWNISRFIINYSESSLEEIKGLEELKLETEADKWIIASLLETAISVEKDVDEYNFSQAADKLNDFTWNKLADWYLEIAKIEKNKGDILLFVLRHLLKLWHPFIPFVSEAIWSNFNKDLLLVAPVKNYANDDYAQGLLKYLDTNNFEIIKNLVVNIRNARSENKIAPAKKLKAVFYSKDHQNILLNNRNVIAQLKTGIESLEPKENDYRADDSIVVISGDIKLTLLKAINKEAEIKRLNKERNKLEVLIKKQTEKLDNKEFVDNAPKEIVQKERDRYDQLVSDLAEIDKLIKSYDS